MHGEHFARRLIGQSQAVPERPYLAADALRLVVEGIVSEELDYSGEMLNLRDGVVILPVRYAFLRHAQQFRNLPL